MTKSPELTTKDVQTLLQNPTDDVKAKLGEKVAHHLDFPEISDSEKELAIKIIEHLAKDTALIIRKTLSENLKNSRSLPRDIAVGLANDIEEVALPIIEFSSVLTDTDLIKIINTGNPTKQVAIAKRSEVSNQVASVLIETNNEDAVAELVSNPGADLKEENYSRVVEKYPGSSKIHENMITKRKLPVAIREKMMNIVSGHLKDYLLKQKGMTDEVVSNVMEQTQEKATIQHISTGSSAEEVADLVRQLAQNGRLTPSIILRAICLGDITFFENAIALLAKVPLNNAKILIHDAGPSSLNALLKKAQVDDKLIPAMLVAVDVRKEMDYDGGENDQLRFRRRMIERILTQYEDMGGDNLDFLIRKFSDLVDATAEAA